MRNIILLVATFPLLLTLMAAERGKASSRTDASVGLIAQVDKLEKELQILRSTKVAPVGSIIAWDRDNQRTPMRGLENDAWVQCNGQILNDAESPYNGMRIPELNNSRRFLRGTPQPPNGKARWPNGEGTMVQEDWATGMPRTAFEIKKDEGSHSHSRIMGGPTGKPQGYPEYAGDTGAGHKTLTLSNGEHDHSIIGGDAETRPVNVRVVWMMRVK